MALNLVLHAFSKKQNSTAIPPQGSGTGVSVTLKQETSLNNPIFILSGGLPVANYAQFESAYYFIDDITSVRANLWEIACTLDVLATYRAAIRNASAFVEYSEQGFSDIPDNRVVNRVNPSVNTISQGIGFNTNGHYNLAAVGSGGGAGGTGGVTIWQVMESDITRILDGVENWADNLFAPNLDTTENLRRGFQQLTTQGSALDAIRSCRWVPFDRVLGSGGFIFLGNYATGVAAYVVADSVTTQTVNLTVPFTRSGVLRCPPYSEVVLYLPFVGNVNISHQRFSNSAQVEIVVSRDNRMGDVTYLIKVGGIPVGSYGGNTGVDIPIGVSNVSAASLITSIAGAAASLSYGNIAGAAGSAAGAFTPTVSAVGGVQGAAGAGLPLDISLTLIEYPISGAVGNMAAVQGLPLFATRTLSSLSGYVKTRGASVSGNMRGALRDRINGMLDSGIFLE